MTRALVALFATLVAGSGALDPARGPAGPAPAPRGENLAKVYAGKLDHVEGGAASDWTSGPEDVWELSSFSYELKGELKIELGPSVVVFGKHVASKRKNDASVVWAAVFPTVGESDEPIVSSEPGHGNHVESIFLRFHPSLVGSLFPTKTVVGHTDPKWSMWGKRLYMFKINASWQAENMPVVPWEHALVFDVETVEGKRRMYMLDLEAKKARYEEAFAQRVVPDPPSDPIGEDVALAAFDEVWRAFDREYAMFVVKPDVDWDALRDVYRPIAASARTNYEAAGAIGLLLDHLEDLHVSVQVAGAWVPGYNRSRLRNANWEGLKAQLTDLHDTQRGVTWARAKHDIGYVCVWNLTTEGLTDAFDEALEKLGDTKGLIVDLRFNGGGEELLGRRIAGRFAEKEHVYSLDQYRSGEEHDDLGAERARSFEPRGPWRYAAPVAVLFGQRTMSSAESLALMLAQCENVTTIGDRTAGSSANPRMLEVDPGISVRLPRWLDMDPDGKPIDAVGIEPDVKVDAPLLDDFRGQKTPVFDAAVDVLRKTRNKKPGRR